MVSSHVRKYREPRPFRETQEGREQRETAAEQAEQEKSKIPEGLEGPAAQAKELMGKAEKYLGVKVVRERSEGWTDLSVDYRSEASTDFGDFILESKAEMSGIVTLSIYELTYGRAETVPLLKVDLAESALSRDSLENWVKRAKSLQESFDTMEKPKDRVPNDPLKWSEEKHELHRQISALAMPGFFTPSQIEQLEPLFDKFEATR